MKAFYDALAYLGQDTGLEAYQASNPESLSGMMDKFGIARALVTAFAARRLHPFYGNEMVFKTAERDERIIPCAVVLPNSGLEIGDESDYVASLIEQGARCAAMYPSSHGSGFDRRVIAPLLTTLEKRRMPLALFETALPQAVEIANQYPDLPILLHRLSHRNRTLLPLLAAAPNLHVSLAPNFIPYRGLETLVPRIGSDRFLFASGWPETDPAAPIGYLLYSALSDEDVQKIAWGNMARLVDGVRVAGLKASSLKRPVLKPSAAHGLGAAVFARKPLPLKGITDMHAHLGKWSEFPIWGGEADDLVAEMDRSGIERTFVSHQACMTTEAAWGNDQVLDAMKCHPGRILGYAACYPVNDQLGIEEIRRCLDAGMSGIKMHTSNGFTYTHDGYKPVWELADRLRLPVLLHTWGDMDDYKSVFETYRQAPILLAHSGSARPALYVEYAKKYPNVFLELCYSMAPYGVIEHFVREIGAKRVLFGTDATWMSFHGQLGRVVFADIDEPEKKTILVDNPVRVLSMRGLAAR